MFLSLRYGKLTNSFYKNIFQRLMSTTLTFALDQFALRQFNHNDPTYKGVKKFSASCFL
jgi:hypothetical protein